MPNLDLSDLAAQRECKRLLQIMTAQRRSQNHWLNKEDPKPLIFDENSAFANGMRSLFRYARGEFVPPPIVMDFIDELLKLMFCGLASNTMALPPFERMSDRPWAIAWRFAELRLGIEGHETLDISQLAHLLGVPPATLRQRLEMVGFCDIDVVPEAFLKEMYQALIGEPEN